MSSKSLSRPVVGITTRLDLKDNTFYLRRFYAEAVAAAGGSPVYLPLLSDPEVLLPIARSLDGVVLSGSASDLDPALYGEEPHQRLGPVAPERDKTDLALLAYIEAERLPLLAICFGIQSLNVSRGGTLYQDIGSQIPGALKHEQGPPVDRPSHSIEITEGSMLARLSGGTKVRVNSTHHQAIKDLGKNLKITARAADGVIEAVEDVRTDRFLLGVEWHPEAGWERNAFSRAIFEALVNAARERER